MVSYTEVCQEAIRAGGAALLERFGRVNVWEKSPGNLVTDADFAAQEIVARTLQTAFPTHEVLGEEGAVDESSAPLDAEFCWVIDPLDGTTNFVHGVPHFSVSLALLHQGELVVGGVLDPIRNELFSAVRGGGAQLNGHSIRPSNVAKPVDALAAVGFPPMVDENSSDLKAFLRAVPRFQAMRRTGSVALNLAYVAMGRFDAAWSYSTRIWDIAAGVLLVRESGGVVSSPRGREIELRSGQCLASATKKLNCEITLLLSTPPLEVD